MDFPHSQDCALIWNGRTWDRHKAAGRLYVPEHAAQHKHLENADLEQENPDRVFVIAAVQEYRFYCSVCGMDAVVSGYHSGPHALLR